jgi:hypothetical protein
MQAEHRSDIQNLLKNAAAAVLMALNACQDVHPEEGKHEHTCEFFCLKNFILRG